MVSSSVTNNKESTGATMPFRLGYATREALSTFRRNFGTSIAAVITIFLSLFIIGLFALATLMVNSVMGDVESRVTIQAFVNDDAPKATIDEVIARFSALPDVDSVKFKNKDEALAEYQRTMTNKNAADAIAQLDGNNPVPASIVIKLKDPQKVEATAQKLGEDAGFVKIADDVNNPMLSVQYGQGSVEKLFALTKYARIIAIVLVGLLTFIAFVFINNTIRLSVMARRLEIGIMRLVGASNGFIRGPFLMEGLIQALIGALCAIGCLELLHHVAMPKLMESLSFLAINIAPIYYYYIYGGLAIIGVVIGVVGSMLAMRRHLKV